MFARIETHSPNATRFFLVKCSIDYGSVVGVSFFFLFQAVVIVVQNKETQCKKTKANNQFIDLPFSFLCFCFNDNYLHQTSM